jgi:predicted NAD/FAD-dependent oxidoreductase
MSDVIVIGAGLAGLQCARVLTRAGRDVAVLEATDGIGGRVRTDLVDGFRLDRGFQLLNPAYPDAKSQLDLRALALQPFGRGVEVRDADGLWRLVATPSGLLGPAGSRYLRPAEVAGLVRWLAPALGSVPRLLAAPDATLAESFAAAGFRGPLRTAVVEPFLAGVLLEAGGSTSARFVRLLARSFALGVPGLPAQGMAAVPQQLAGELRGPVELETPATAVIRDGGRWVVHTPRGERPATSVVFAVDPPSAHRLAGVAVPAMKGVVTWWFAADRAPSASRFLLVEGRPAAGPVLNSAVVSNVAPGYAPAGRHLVQASALLGADGVPDEAVVRGQLATLYDTATDSWQLLATHAIPDALPAMPPSLEVRRPVRINQDLYVCGDHRDTASIQGALVSGRRTAEVILAG